eukprot:COSAG01_NODE_13636_length_1555_cov_1.560440_2_plen_170_part_01
MTVPSCGGAQRVPALPPRHTGGLFAAAPNVHSCECIQVQCKQRGCAMRAAALSSSSSRRRCPVVAAAAGDSHGHHHHRRHLDHPPCCGASCGRPAGSALPRVPLSSTSPTTMMMTMMTTMTMMMHDTADLRKVSPLRHLPPAPPPAAALAADRHAAAAAVSERLSRGRSG